MPEKVDSPLVSLGQLRILLRLEVPGGQPNRETKGITRLLNGGGRGVPRPNTALCLTSAHPLQSREKIADGGVEGCFWVSSLSMYHYCPLLVNGRRSLVDLNLSRNGPFY